MVVDGVPGRTYYRTPATAPGPAGWQMLAQFGAVANRPMEFLRSAREQFGPVVQFPIPQPPTYLIDDPHLVRSVLMAYDHDFDKDTVQYRALSLVTGEGLLSAPEASWRKQRPVVQPAFHRSTLQRLVGDAQAATARLIRRWDLVPSGAVVDVESAMLRVGLEVVGSHLFDADLQRSAPRLARATMDALDAVIASVRLPWAVLRGLPSPARSRYRAALAALDAAVDDLVRERRASGPQREDLLGLLLAAYPDDPVAVRNQIITFLVAGHETVASALTWTLGLLAQHPLEQARAAAEAAEVLGGAMPGLAELDLLPQTRACFDEGLRLYPPAWVVTRSASRRMVIGGREIPAGALLIISPWLLHRDRSRWPLPDRFLPERFAGKPGAVARGATTRAEYLPFGTGPRLCIGRDFALLEAGVVMAPLLERYRLELLSPALPDVEPLVTLRPRGGLRLRLWQR